MHADAPWIASVGLALAATLAWTLTRARHFPRATRLARRAPVVHSLEGLGDGDLVALDATLAVTRTDGGPAAVTVELFAGSASHHAAPGLHLVLDDGARAPLEGSVRVESGTAEAESFDELGADSARVEALASVATGIARGALTDSVARVRVVSEGDRVLCVGRVRRRAAQDVTAYRDARVQVALAPDGEGFTLLADTPHPASVMARRVTTRAAWALVAVHVLWAAWSSSLLALAGERVRAERVGERVSLVYAGRAWAARAALWSPFDRARAHRVLTLASRQVMRHTRESVAASLAHAAASGDCDAGLEIAMEHGLGEEAARVARDPACRRMLASRKALGVYVAGAVTEASERFSTAHTPFVDLEASYLDVPDFDLRVHLLAGDRERAEGVARARAGRVPEPRARLLRCVADHLTVAGQGTAASAARRRLEREVADTRDPVCTLLLEDVETWWQSDHSQVAVDVVRRSLAEAPFAGRPSPLAASEARRWNALRAAIASRHRHAREPFGEACDEDWSALVVAPDQALARRVPGVEHGALRAVGATRHFGEALAQLNLRCSVAAYEALTGDARRAVELLDEADAAVREVTRPRAREWDDARTRVSYLRGVVQLVAGDRGAARAALAEVGDGVALPGLQRARALAEAEGTVTEAMLAVEPGLAPELRRGWSLVDARDGTGAARELEAHAWRALPTWLVGGADRFADGHAELGEWLRWNAPAACVTCPAAQRLAQLAAWRRAARGLGVRADEDSTRLLREALRRPEGAVARMVIEGLSRPGW